MSSFGTPYEPSERHLPCQVERYRVVRRWAKGTTSEIFLARQEGPLGFERLVILKLLLPELRGDGRARGAMLCEAAAYARVSHPAVVMLHDFVEHERRIGVVLEHVDGLPLHELRAQLHRLGERLSDAASLYTASRLFAALAAAHVARHPATGEFTPVIHADVNPSNVLVPWDGYVKLADFGSARVAGMIEHAAAPAVHPYLAPEQARGRETSTRTDVYSGCLLLWELLTDRRAIAPNRRSTREMLEDIARPKLPSLASLRPDLPPPLVSVVDRGIEPAADRRHVAAADVFAVLRESTDLVSARIELAEMMGVLRRPTLEAERFETTPQQPKASPPMAHPPGRDRAISATFWLTDDSGSPLPLDISVADAAGTEKALGEPTPAPVSDASPQTNPPVVLKKEEPRPVGSTYRARAVTACVAAAAALAVAFVATTLRFGRRHDVRVVATAPQGPTPTAASAAASDVAPRSSPAFDGAAAMESKTPAPCSSGWVVVPPSRAGHRVWINGRIVGESPGRFPVSSGRHAVRVGSRGVGRGVVLGCGEEQLAR